MKRNTKKVKTGTNGQIVFARLDEIKSFVDNPSTKNMIENAQKIIGLVCDDKVKCVSHAVWNEDSMIIGLFNGIIHINVHFEDDEINVERHCNEYDEFNESDINGVADLVKKEFAEHSESKGYIYLED